MKVLMLGWELPPHNSGGLGVACHQLCKALSRKNVDIEFILPYQAQHDAKFMTITAAYPQGVVEVLKSGIAYDSYKYVYSDGHEEWVDLYQQQQLYEHAVADMAPDKEFDIIHAHDWLTFRAGLRARQLSGKPLIVHIHSIESDRAGGIGGNPLVREIESMGLMMADRVVAVSQHTKDAIIRDYRIPADKIDVVHNSIEKTDVPEIAQQNIYTYLTALKSQGSKVVVNVGRLTIQKGLPNLLRAAKLVVEHEPKTMFLIVGAGEQYNQLMELAAELGIGANVLFTGFQRGQAWRDAFAIGDLFVMPSISEPFGLTPLEAIQYGTPSLISKQSGVSEVLLNCLKVDFWDVEEMANQITTVVRHPNLHDNLRDNMFQEYQRLSWNDSVDKLFDIYKHHTRRKIAA
jgi:glycosyltransferase involved in cell wall biosynthesis